MTGVERSNRPPRPARAISDQAAGRRLSVAGAAALLGVCKRTVYRMIERGQLQVAFPGEYRQLLVTDVEEAGCRRIAGLSAREAAQQLGCSIKTVRSLLEDAVLTGEVDTKRPVNRSDVERLLADGWRPSPEQRPRKRTRRKHDTAHVGRVPVSVAAAVLGWDESAVRARAGEERLPATVDKQGRFWFRLEDLERLKRARNTERRNHRPVTGYWPGS